MAPKAKFQKEEIVAAAASAVREKGMQAATARETVDRRLRPRRAVFIKTKANALTSDEFATFTAKNGIDEFFVTGADATACVKSTCYNMAKAGFTVHVISDCITSYDLKKLDELLAYYEQKGCEVKTLAEITAEQ